MVAYEYQINYKMFGTQKPSLQQQVNISNSIAAQAISKITFHYEPPCSSKNTESREKIRTCVNK